MSKKRKQNDDSDSSSDSDGDSDIGYFTDDAFPEHGVSVTRMPDYPHPDVKKLPDLSFDILPENFFICVYGARRTGKTHALTCLMEEIADRFDFAYLFSETSTLHKNEKGQCNFDFIRDEAKFDGFDDEVLTRIIERQVRVKEFNNDCKYKRDQKPNKTLIIFDDFVHNKEVRYSTLFTKLPVLGRHMDLSVVCLSQGYASVASGGLNGATRMNSDLTMTFLPRNNDDLQRISKWYLSCPEGEGMWFCHSACLEEHRCLAIDLTKPNETELVNYCYTYQAPAKIPKFECGKVQWKLYKEEKKRMKAAAEEMKFAQSRAYYITPGSDMSHTRMVNTMTGSEPVRVGRLSLYDVMHQASLNQL